MCRFVTVEVVAMVFSCKLAQTKSGFFVDSKYIPGVSSTDSAVSPTGALPSTSDWVN